MARKNK